MRFLLALDNFSRGSGGAPASARELAQALLAAGHALHVLETGRPGRESWNGAALERVRLHGPLLPADRDLRTLVLNPRWCRRVAGRIAELRPDLVVTQGMLAPGAIAAARAAGLPAAYFFRGYAPLCPEQYVGLDPDQCRRPDCSRCLTLARRLKWPLVRGVLDLYDRTIPKADLIIANSRYIAGLLKRFWDVAAEVVYPTLDLPVASAPENSPGGYLLFVKPQAAKGLDVLVGLAAACPGRKFAVAGELGGSAARRLAALPNVQTLGWRTDMPAVYRGARAVLVPSLLPEPFGRVVAEAAACGCPAIAYRVGGLPEAAGDSAVLLERSATVADWKAAVDGLDYGARYETLRLAVLHSARRLAAEGGARFLVALLEDAVSRGPRPAPAPPPPGRRLRVVHVISALPVGGAETFLYQLLTRLSRERFEPEVVCIRAEDALAETFRRAGVPVTLLKLPSRYSPAGLFRLARCLARSGTDIVHTHMRRANTSGRIAAWLAGVQVIVAHEHNPGPDKSRWHFLVDRLLGRVSAAVIAVSRDTAGRNARAGGLPLERFTVLPNPVDLGAFRPGDRAAARAALGVPADDFAVGFVGRLHPVKNLDALLRAAARAAAEVPSLRVLIAGDGEERGKLQALAAKLGVADRVTFLGERSDMPAVYPAFDLLCLPSRSEGNSMVLIEAAAAGLPLVATPVGYAPEMVGRAEEAGLLVPVGDAAALAGAFVRLAADAGLRERMGRAARAAAGSHGLDQYVKELERLYLELWSRK